MRYHAIEFHCHIDGRTTVVVTFPESDENYRLNRHDMINTLNDVGGYNVSDVFSLKKITQEEKEELVEAGHSYFNLETLIIDGERRKF